MKKIIASLLFCCGCCLLNPMQKASADDVYYYHPDNASLRLPLDFLMNWDLEQYSKRDLYFQHRDYEDVDLNIKVSVELPPEITLDLITTEVSNYLNGFTTEIPLLAYAFPEDEQDIEDEDFEDEDFDIDVEDEGFAFDDFDFDFNDDDLDFVDFDLVDFDDDEDISLEMDEDEIIDIDDLGFEDISGFVPISFHNIDWMMVQFKSPVLVTTYPSNGPGYVSELIWERHFVFLTLINNRIYAIDLSAPSESYFDYEEVFFDTMLEISEYANVLLGIDPQITN